MTSTDLAAPDPEGGKYLALSRDTTEIREMIEDTLAGQDVSEFDLPRLKVPSGGATAWEMDDPVHGVQSLRELRGVIVHTGQTRTWWPTSLDDEDGGGGQPSCSSRDAKTGIGWIDATPANPRPDTPPRQTLCATCPHSQWGSGKNGGQACQLKGQWFLLQEGSFLPIIVTLPAMSLKPARKYLLGLIGAGMHPSSVETVITLTAEKRGSNKFAVVTPKLGEKLDPDTAQRARAYGALLKPLFERQATQETGTDEPPLAEAA